MRPGPHRIGTRQGADRGQPQRAVEACRLITEVAAPRQQRQRPRHGNQPQPQCRPEHAGAGRIGGWKILVHGPEEEVAEHQAAEGAHVADHGDEHGPPAHRLGARGIERHRHVQADVLFRFLRDHRRAGP